jgi:acetylglutamate kinase
LEFFGVARRGWNAQLGRFCFMSSSPESSVLHSRMEALIEALPYIQKYRGQTFVIKYGGSAMEDEAVVAGMLRDVVFLEAVGINPVLIHGGGKAITARMKEAGIAARFVNGLRVTDAASIGIVEEVLDSVINPAIVAQLNACGGRAVGIPGKRVLRASKLPPQREEGQEVDLGFVGEVLDVRLAEVERAIESEALPVISPLAMDESGARLNINADIAAGTIAGGLRAAKMIYLSDVPGLMRDPKDVSTLISSASRAQIAELVEEGVIAGGMLPKVDSALNALQKGVRKVHFIDGRTPHALLLEVFTDAGIGTEIVG